MEKKEKVKQAIALEYDPNDEAPRVIASGRGALAERIIEKAIHHCPEDTPIRFDVVAVDGEEMNWIKGAFDYII